MHITGPRKRGCPFAGWELRLVHARALQCGWLLCPSFVLCVVLWMALIAFCVAVAARPRLLGDVAGAAPSHLFYGERRVGVRRDPLGE